MELNSSSTKTLTVTEYEAEAMHTAVRAGSLMINAGAEAYRCEDTMRVILDLADKENDSYVLGTGLIATLNTESELPLTMAKRVKSRGLNLNIIDSVNQITRDLINQKIDFKTANLLMDTLNKPLYSQRLKILCTLIMTGAFSLLLSGNIIDATGGFIDGFLLVLIYQISIKYQFRAFITNVSAGLLLSIGAMFIGNFLLPNANQDMIIAGSLMLLFPGTAFTAAIRDTIHGDFVSALTKALEAFMVALALSIGVGLGLSLSHYLYNIF